MKKYFCFIGLLIMCSSGVFAQSVSDAKKLTDSEQYEAASQIYNELIAKSPSDVSLYYFYGDNLLNSENSDSAKIIFDKGKSLDPNNALIKIGEAKLKLNNIDIGEARAASQKDSGNGELKRRLEDALANVEAAKGLINSAISGESAKDPLVLIEAAEALINYKNKDLDKAKELLDKATGLDSKRPEINLLFGDLYAEKNNGTLSADYYNRALEQNKASARAIVSKGRLYKRSTNYEGAAQEFKNAIELNPGYAPAHRELGEAYFKLGKLGLAKEEYKKYLELSKNNCGARIRYASFLYISKAYQEALNEIDHLKQKCDPNNITMLRILAYCYYEIKDTTNGFNIAEKLFQLLPPDSRAAQDYEVYGKLLIATNRDSLGIGQLKKAYSLDPTRADLLSEIASAWYKLKQYPQVIAVYNEKLEGGKDIRITDYFYLGQAYYYNRQFTDADSTFMKLNEISPKFARAWYWRAKVNTQMDTTSELGLAKPFYESFVENLISDSATMLKSQPQLIEAYSYLAYFYILHKDNNKALEYLKKKMELPLNADDHKNVQQAIDQLEGKTPQRK